MRSRGMVPHSIEPLVALQAMRKLIADPDDTAQVFRIIRALTGNSFERLFQRVIADPTGLKVLDEMRDILVVLQDRARLNKLPEGSLGREYARFLDREAISAEGLVHASGDDFDQAVFLDERCHLLSHRLRDTHDLWHVVTGYQRDIFGEAALLSFTYAQTRNPGVGFIVVIATLKLWMDGHGDFMSLAWDAYWRGRRAGFFCAADWEALLPMPLAEVRRVLKITDLPSYTPMFSTAAAPAH